MPSRDNLENAESTTAPAGEAAVNPTATGMATPPVSNNPASQPMTVTTTKRLPKIKIINRPVWPATWKVTFPPKGDDDDEWYTTDLSKKHIFRPEPNENGISEVFVGRVRLPASHPDNAIFPRNLAYTRGGNRPQTSIYGFGATLLLGHSTETSKLTHDHHGVITINITPDRLEDYLFGDALLDHGLDTTGWEFQIIDPDGEYNAERDDTYQVGKPENELVFCGRKHFQPVNDSGDQAESKGRGASKFDGMGWVPLKDIVRPAASGAKDGSLSSASALADPLADYANINMGKRSI